MRVKKTIVMLVLVVMFSSFTFTVCAATHYILTGNGYWTNNVPINTSNVTEWSYLYRWGNAMNYWNNSGAGVSIYSDDSSYNELRMLSLTNQTYYGMYYWNPLFQIITSGRVKKFEIRINIATAPLDTMESTMAHEIGHVFNLDDNPCNETGYYNSSIMNYGRNKSMVYSPTSWDIEGVLATTY